MRLQLYLHPTSHLRDAVGDTSVEHLRLVVQTVSTVVKRMTEKLIHWPNNGLLHLLWWLLFVVLGRFGIPSGLFRTSKLVIPAIVT